MNLRYNKKTAIRISIFVLSLLLLFFIGRDELSAAPPNAPPGLQRAIQAQEAHTNELIGNPDVVGTAVGIDSAGNPLIQVFTASEGVRGIPANIDGFPVVVNVTGRIVAYKRPSSSGSTTSGVSHKANQTPAIQLGTSGGWKFDLANGYCCGGTLGSLVTDGSNMYILSNWHVLYSDIVTGGNGITANFGNPVIQPGLIDVSCNASNAQNVATLLAPSDGGSLPSANVDAGIAQIILSPQPMVDTSGAILEIGAISKTTVAASIGQAVKKSGRTTGLSKSSISGLNGTVKITYENECAGGTAFTKTFTGQIIIKNSKCGFLNSGDSGSLMVENVTTKPRAVGLLYAGSSSCGFWAIAIANPIQEVLDYFSSKLPGTFTMVGN
jgi:hypothetical protein